VNRFIVDHAPMSMRAGLLDAVKNISHQLQTQSKNLSNNVLQTVQTLGARVVPQTFNLLSSGATILFQLLIVLVLSLFMSLQGRPFVRSVVAYLPRSLDPDIEAVFKTVNHAFGGFIRGQLILSTIYGVLIFAVMRVFALIVPNSGDLAGFAAVSGVLGGLILIIPAIGTTLSMVPPLAIGLLVLQDLPRFLILLVVIWVIQIFIANVAGPRVMSDSVGVNTLLTFGALLVGGKLGGLLGAFFAVPILAVVLTIVERVYLRLPHHALTAAGQAPIQGPPPPIAVTPPPADTQRTRAGGTRPARRLGKFGALPHRRHR
jgi:predicted PurR-regulated permease PerM